MRKKKIFSLVFFFKSVGRESLHLQTLKAFVDLHKFTDLNLVQALRLASFICISIFTVVLTIKIHQHEHQ